MLEVEKEGFKVGRCKLCGQPVVWAERTDKPGRIPLDPKAPVFVAKQGLEGQQYAMQLKYRLKGERLLVSHFSTCPAKTRAWKLLEECERLMVAADSEAVAHVKRVREYLGR